MTHRFVIELPDEAIHDLNEIAAATGRSIEEVLTDTLVTHLPVTLDADMQMEAMTGYMDEALWDVVRRHLTLSQEKRLKRLLDKNKIPGELTEPEQKELTSLVNLVDHYMLLRSQALLLLKQRGHDVSKYFNPAGR